MLQKKLLILVSRKDENKEKLADYLTKHFGDNVGVALADFSDLVFEIESGKVLVEIEGKNICDFNLIYFRKTAGFYSMAAALSIYLESVGIKFFDKVFINGSFTGDKFTSLMRLAVNNLPIVPSFLCWKGVLPKTKKRIVEKFGFPIVAKEVTTQRMQSVFLIKSFKDFDKLPDRTVNEKDARYLFQKFINFDKEFRLLVLKENVGVVHTKTMRDNTGFQIGYSDMEEQPEFLDPFDVPAKIKEAAIKAAKVLHIQVAGVDIAREKETGRIYIFEVNRGPGLEYDTSVSLELPKIAEFFESEISST